jgi:hypothetical protein
VPTVSGTARDGETLTASPGSWDGSPQPASFAYQWRRDNADISGATSKTYRLVSSDVGHNVLVRVTAVGAGTSSADSSPTATVLAAAPVSTGAPTVTGAAVQGQTLQTSNGSWSGTSPRTYIYAWKRCDTGGASCSSIGGASAASYTLTAADVGSTIRSNVTATNSVGSASAQSDPTRVVQGTDLGAGNPSATCTSPSARVVDGYAGESTYVELRIQQHDTRTTWVCYRTSDSEALGLGGRVDIVAPSGGVGTPSVDADYTACQNASGNAVPPPHPLVAGQVGDASDPSTYVPFALDTYSSSGSGWVCLQVGTQFEKRVVVPASSTSPPDVTNRFDAPGVTDPSPVSGPAGYPSSTCQAGTGGTKRQLANLDLGGTQLWAYEYEPSSSTVDVCVRAQGQASAGGMLTLDTTGMPGVTPSYGQFDDTTGCGINVISQTQPVAFSITRSLGTNPASLCISATPPSGSPVTKRVTLGATGTPTPPAPSWHPDPGTP